MKSNKLIIQHLASSLIVICIAACTSSHPQVTNHLPDTETAFDYLKALEGKWEVHGDKEGVFGWEFDVTSRGRVIIEKLKVGTPAEMMTVYHLDLLDNGNLVGRHYCQLQNQPNLTAVTSDVEGDLHFLCDGSVGNTLSHDELHMHGVHYQKNDSSLLIWMDMFENEKIAFETRYELFRIDSLRNQEETQ